MLYPNRFRYMGLLDRYLQGVCYAALSLSLFFLGLAVYRLFHHEKYSKTPTDLMESVQLATININKEHSLSRKSKRYDELARWKLSPLSAEPYLTGTWYPAIKDYHLRSVPQLYSVQSLQVSAGFGAFSVNRATNETGSRHGDRTTVPQGNWTTQGYRWIIVTGVIEDRKQIQAFETAFRRAQYRNPALDCPDYQYFQVERAEIHNGNGDDNLSWKQRPVQPMYDLKNRWSRVSDDLVHEKYFPPPRNGISLVFPLGPLENDAWNDAVGHPWISLYEAAIRNSHKIKSPPAVAEDKDPFQSATNRISSPLRRQGHLISGQNVENIASTAKPDILFMRYIDYDVEPGKMYRYRLKLVLQNPNWHVPEKYLQNPSLNQSRCLESSWSEPSPVVSMPPETKIELVAVNALHRYALVKLIHFDLQTGGYRPHDFKVERGQIMNYYNQEYYPPTDSSEEHDLSLLMPSRRGSLAPQQVDYVTDAVLIDYRESKRLPGRQRLIEPSRILIRDREGNLIVMEENKLQIQAQPKMPGQEIAATPKVKSID